MTEVQYLIYASFIHYLTSFKDSNDVFLQTIEDEAPATIGLEEIRTEIALEVGTKYYSTISTIG